MKVILSIGTNLGNRKENVRRAEEFIKRFVGEILRMSSLVETEPFGVKRQPPFLNRLIVVESPHPPFELLNLLKQAERRIGRFKTFRWGPRTIDIDIVKMEGLRINTPKLHVPHRGLRNRNYLKELMAELMS